MVETEMQRTASRMEEADFAMAGFFKEAHLNGKLQSTNDLIKHLKNIIEKEFETGRIMNYFES